MLLSLTHLQQLCLVLYLIELWILHFCREELLNNRLAEYHSSRGIGSESLLMQESVTRMCDDIESMDEEPPMYEEAQPSQEAPEQPAVDCENSGLIWVPPPPEDDEDEVGTSMVICSVCLPLFEV